MPDAYLLRFAGVHPVAGAHQHAAGYGFQLVVRQLRALGPREFNQVVGSLAGASLLPLFRRQVLESYNSP